MLGTLLIFVYIRFQDYKPKVLKQIQEIKGISIKRDVLPYPTGSVKISETSSLTNNHITLKVPVDYKKVKSFYENILLERGWKIESEETNNTFHILKFKQKKETITIISTLEMEDSNIIVSIEITKATKVPTL